MYITLTLTSRNSYVHIFFIDLNLKFEFEVPTYISSIKCQNHEEDGANFCSLFSKAEFYHQFMLLGTDKVLEVLDFLLFLRGVNLLIASRTISL